MPTIRINVTVPKEIINADTVRQAIVRAQNRVTIPSLKGLFERTVQGWHHDPSFNHRRIDSSNQLGVFVFPSGAHADQWALVNAGARPHRIRARRSRILRFRVGYRAGTTPRSLTSRGYARSGRIVTPMAVSHPGFEAREFTQTIADTHAPDFEQDMQDAITDATRK